MIRGDELREPTSYLRATSRKISDAWVTYTDGSLVQGLADIRLPPRRGTDPERKNCPRRLMVSLWHTWTPRAWAKEAKACSHNCPANLVRNPEQTTASDLR
jgi:hypothetical protein